MLWVSDIVVINKIKEMITDALPLVFIVSATGTITPDTADINEKPVVYRIDTEYPLTLHRGITLSAPGRIRKYVATLGFSNPYVDTTQFEHKLATEEYFINVDLPEGKRRYPITLSGLADMSMGKSPNSNNQIALTFTIAE